ncbi:MAG: hypothetical protein IKF68_01370 [Erysipelotrichaceae bacterium]|nr:hypothetical protein [Erysipelotrichaceae bacterium]
MNTREYYDSLTDEDICDCIYCRNYIKRIRSSYPLLSSYLDSLCIDIEKPYETVPLEPYEGHIVYAGVMYMVMGDPKEFEKTTVEGVDIHITDSYPYTDMKEKHYVIELDEIKLAWDE